MDRGHSSTMGPAARRAASSTAGWCPSARAASASSPVPERLNREPAMEPRISFITLGVRDLERATRFYKAAPGLPPLPSPPGGVSFFEMGRTWLSLYPREDLAADAGVPAEGSGFSGVALAHNVR